MCCISYHRIASSVAPFTMYKLLVNCVQPHSIRYQTDSYMWHCHWQKRNTCVSVVPPAKQFGNWEEKLARWCNCFELNCDWSKILYHFRSGAPTRPVWCWNRAGVYPTCQVVLGCVCLTPFVGIFWCTSASIYSELALMERTYNLFSPQLPDVCHPSQIHLSKQQLQLLWLTC